MERGIQSNSFGWDVPPRKGSLKPPTAPTRDLRSSHLNRTFTKQSFDPELVILWIDSGWWIKVF